MCAHFLVTVTHKELSIHWQYHRLNIYLYLIYGSTLSAQAVNIHHYNINNLRLKRMSTELRITFLSLVVQGDNTIDEAPCLIYDNTKCRIGHSVQQSMCASRVGAKSHCHSLCQFTASV